MIYPVLKVEAFEVETDRLAFTMEGAVLLEIDRSMRIVMEDAADYARVNHPYQDRTNELTGSIRGGVAGVSEDGIEGYVEAVADHASLVEEGTREHEIVPRRSSVLRWEDDGGEEHFAKRVQHPGTPAMPFIQPAAHVAGARFVNVFNERIEKRLKRLLRGQKA